MDDAVDYISDRCKFPRLLTGLPCFTIPNPNPSSIRLGWDHLSASTGETDSAEPDTRFERESDPSPFLGRAGKPLF